MMKLPHWLLTFACLGSPVFAEEVYRDVDENGVPTFSDQVTPGAEPIQIKETTTFSNEISIPSLRKSQPEPDKDQSRITYSVKITSPADGAAIRENTGALTLEVALSPFLAQGHKAELMMDGQKIRSLNGAGPVSLTNVDRGTHAFSVRVVDANGKLRAQSEPVSVTMLRYSKPRPPPT